VPRAGGRRAVRGRPSLVHLLLDMMLYRLRSMFAPAPTPPAVYRTLRRSRDLSANRLAKLPLVDVDPSLILQAEGGRRPLSESLRTKLDYALALGEQGESAEPLYLLSVEDFRGKRPFYRHDGAYVGCRSRSLADAIAGWLRHRFPNALAVPIPAWLSFIGTDALLLVDGDDPDSPLSRLFDPLDNGPEGGDGQTPAPALEARTRQ
jgi:hypothetical protein